MAIQASGTIDISDLRTEFGGSTPDSISEYYRGGGLVPDIGANSGVPTSGSISLSDFYSAQAGAAPEFDLADYAATDANINAPSTATIIFGTDAIISVVSSGNGGNFKNAGDVTTADYDIRLTHDSGDDLTGALNSGTWYTLDVSRSFSMTRTFTGTSIGDFTIELRPTGGGSTIDTATLTITSVYIPF